MHPSNVTKHNGPPAPEPKKIDLCAGPVCCGRGTRWYAATGRCVAERVGKTEAKPAARTETAKSPPKYPVPTAR